MPNSIIPITRYLRNKIRKLFTLNSIEKEFNLSVSKRVLLKNKWIGLDSIKKKLLIVRNNNDKPVYCIINLKDVQHCSVKTTYDPIGAGSLKKQKLEEFIKSISLHLGFSGGGKSIIVKFYENTYNQLTELPLLQIKAKEWAQIVSGSLAHTNGERRY